MEGGPSGYECMCEGCSSSNYAAAATSRSSSIVDERLRTLSRWPQPHQQVLYEMPVEEEAVSRSVYSAPPNSDYDFAASIGHEYETIPDITGDTAGNQRTEETVPNEYANDCVYGKTPKLEVNPASGGHRGFSKDPRCSNYKQPSHCPVTTRTPHPPTTSARTPSISRTMGVSTLLLYWILWGMLFTNR